MQILRDSRHGQGDVEPEGRILSVIEQVGFPHIRVIFPCAIPEALHAPVGCGTIAIKGCVIDIGVTRIPVEGVIVPDATVRIVL